MQSLQLSNYLENLKKREVKKTAKTRIAELVTPYLPELLWTDDTFFSDMQGFWVAVYTYMKSHTEDQLLKLLDWLKGKHPRVAIKVLRR